MRRHDRFGSQWARQTFIAALRATGARSYDALIAAVGNICGLFDADECWNFLKASGYVYE